MVDGDYTKVDYILKANFKSILNWLVLFKERNEEIKAEIEKQKHQK